MLLKHCQAIKPREWMVYYRSFLKPTKIKPLVYYSPSFTIHGITRVFLLSGLMALSSKFLKKVTCVNVIIGVVSVLYLRFRK